MELPLIDNLRRPVRDLRISITDRCNFRCTYCMPKEIFGRDYPFLPKGEILSYEEIARLTRIFVGLGVTKARITGGEPLLRRDVDSLIRTLRTQTYENGGLNEVTLTTNGARLASMASALVEAGLSRVTVSLDSLDEDTFGRMNGVDHPVSQVLEGIEAALAAGLDVKVNMVVQRGVNEESILPMARHFRGTPIVLRFIEYMDVGASNGWKMDDVIPAADIIRMIDTEFPLEPLDPNYTGEVARRYRYNDGSGEIGVITSVTQPFCSSCTRARLSADGKLYTCLFAAGGFDLRSILRSDSSDAEVAEAISLVWRNRSDRYSEIRTDSTAGLIKVEMSRIGG